jgi:tetratricopeptide (TPR) repeat protein/cold shock CspA family protein
MPPIELPPHLVTEIEHGHVVLMLGAGASLEAVNDKGEKPPTARKLAEMLAKRFLPSDFETLPLSEVAGYAINESDLFTVQDCIRDYLASFNTTRAHQILSTFRWKGIATTNYDLLIENGYKKNSSPPQRIVPFIDNTDRYDDLIRDRNDLLLIKLHGCMTRTRNTECPLILTTDQFVAYNKGRSRLFSKFKEWASERSIVFLGYGLQDTNLRQILEEIDNENQSRPRFYLVSPDVNDVKKRFWEGKRITAISATFAEFFDALDKAVGPEFRGLIPPTDPGSDEIKLHFTRADTVLSNNATQFLQNDVDYVKGVNATENIDPQLFYKGADGEWSAIDRQLDVRRHLMDTILMDYFLGEPGSKDPRLNLLIVKAHAGAGKSVLLRRMAWDAAKDYGKICLFLRPEGVINAAALSELAEQTSETIYLFIDTILDRKREMEQLFRVANTVSGRVTIISAARTNEWNQAPDSLTSLTTEEYTLPYLSNREIDKLLALLEQHKALGRLQGLSAEERKAELQERAGRQLLVALHEATLGKPFELIIADEYNKVTPQKAQQIYLTVCLLNQFGVPVRAGVISRMHGVHFERFRKEFFAPLEGLITTGKDKKSRDYTYAARHPHISEIVVRTALENRDDLHHAIISTIQYLSTGHQSDYAVLRGLLSARTLHDQFPDYGMVTQVFETARKAIGEDPFLYLQQLAIYEMIRSTSSLSQAEKLIRRALDLRPDNPSLRHTLSEVFVRKAEAASTPVERERYRTEAAQICKDLKRAMGEAYPYYTLVKIGTRRVRDALADPDTIDQTIEALIRATEKELEEGHQRFPANAYLLAAEAEFAEVLSRSDRALVALRKSFEINPRNPFIAVRLANCYLKQAKPSDAVAILRKALEAKSGDQKLHFSYAQMLIDGKLGSNDDILYHLERSYSAGDQNYEAQFLHARQLFLLAKHQESRKLFTHLKSVRIPPAIRREIRYPLEPRFAGIVSRLESSYCFLERDGDGQWVFLAKEAAPDDLWNTLSHGTRVSFRIGFSMSGPSAFDVQTA